MWTSGKFSNTKREESGMMKKIFSIIGVIILGGLIIVGLSVFYAEKYFPNREIAIGIE